MRIICTKDKIKPNMSKIKTNVKVVYRYVFLIFMFLTFITLKFLLILVGWLLATADGTSNLAIRALTPPPVSQSRSDLCPPDLSVS